METITNLDESKVLGYFETIRSVFLMKHILLTQITKKDVSGLDIGKISTEAIEAVENCFEEPNFYNALRNGNVELMQNFHEDSVGSIVIDAWNVFEQVTKDLASPNYSESEGRRTVNYHNSNFQFREAEKRELDLFYYIRNAMYHHNGAYHREKSVDFTYRDRVFKSVGHEGEKIVLNGMLAWSIAKDLEKYTLKAWASSKQRQR